MMPTMDADDAWCPPTFTPDDVVRTWLAWWTMLVANHSTRRWTCSRTSSGTPPVSVLSCGAMPPS